MALFGDVRRKVLDNGLEILVREDRSAPVAALNFFVRVGSLNEDDSIAGWSHGIEHMLFKGTERRGPGDIAREIADAGGETNAGTGYESTNYYITLPARNVSIALDIHADVLRHSTFDEFELEKERQVLIKENEMYRDRPSGYGFTWEVLLEDAFTTHRYQRAIGGPDENLLRVGRDQIVAYKNRYYVPNNITYVVVGDVNAEHVFQAIEDKLGSWKRGDQEPDLPTAEPPQTELRGRITTGDVEKVYAKIGFHIPPELHPDTNALLVLAHVLGSGRSSRLYQRVREEKGLILGATTLETTGREPGYLVVEFTAEPDTADEALDAVMAEIVRFQVEPATPEELERTLRAVRNDMIYTLETMEGQASMLGHYALLGDHTLAGAYLDRLAAVTPARIQDVARRFLSVAQATVLVHRPGDPEAPSRPASGLLPRLNAAATTALAGPATEASDRAIAAELPAIDGGQRDEVQSFALDSGTRVLLQKDPRLPLVSLAAYLPTGSATETDAEAGVSRFMQACMMKGAGGRSAADLDEAMESMGARIRPFTSRDVSGFSLSVVRTDLDPALDLFRTVLGRPDFPGAAIDRERTRTLAEIASLRDNTVQFTITDFFRQLFPGHPYGRRVEGTEASVSAIDREALQARHRALWDPSRLVLSVVGDVDEVSIRRQLKTLVAALPQGERSPGTVPAAVHNETSVRNDLVKDVSQAVVVLGYPGPRLDAEDRYALDVWNAVLSGMGARLFTRLRDEQHLCYFTGAFVSPLSRGGAVGAYVGTGPEQVDQALEALVKELEISAAEPPTAEELNRAQNNLAGSYLIDLQTRMAWASTYARNEVSGLGYQETFRYLDAIRAVTAEQVREAAERYIDPSRLVISVLRSDDEAGVPETVGA